MHFLFEGHAVSAPLLIGTPPGAVFVLLRAEALFGGRGDRFAGATPFLIAVLPWAVHRLHRSSLNDWNRRPLVGRAASHVRPAPWAAAVESS